MLLGLIFYNKSEKYPKEVWSFWSSHLVHKQFLLGIFDLVTGLQAGISTWSPAVFVICSHAAPPHVCHQPPPQIRQQKNPLWHSPAHLATAFTGCVESWEENHDVHSEGLHLAWTKVSQKHGRRRGLGLQHHSNVVSKARVPQAVIQSETPPAQHFFLKILWLYLNLSSFTWELSRSLLV